MIGTNLCEPAKLSRARSREFAAKDIKEYEPLAVSGITCDQDEAKKPNEGQVGLQSMKNVCRKERKAANGLAPRKRNLKELIHPVCSFACSACKSAKPDSMHVFVASTDRTRVWMKSYMESGRVGERTCTVLRVRVAANVPQICDVADLRSEKLSTETETNI